MALHRLRLPEKARSAIIKEIEQYAQGRFQICIEDDVQIAVWTNEAVYGILKFYIEHPGPWDRGLESYMNAAEANPPNWTTQS